MVSRSDGSDRMTFSLHGIGASKGIAIGKVHMVARGLLEVPEYFLDKSAIEKEVQRFGEAVEEARAELGAIKDHIPPDTDSDIAAFIDTHLLMLDDAAITSAPIRFGTIPMIESTTERNRTRNMMAIPSMTTPRVEICDLNRLCSMLL